MGQIYVSYKYFSLSSENEMNVKESTPWEINYVESKVFKLIILIQYANNYSIQFYNQGVNSTKTIMFMVNKINLIFMKIL